MLTESPCIYKISHQIILKSAAITKYFSTRSQKFRRNFNRPPIAYPNKLNAAEKTARRTPTAAGIVRQRRRQVCGRLSGDNAPNCLTDTHAFLVGVAREHDAFDGGVHAELLRKIPTRTTGYIRKARRRINLIQCFSRNIT